MEETVSQGGELIIGITSAIFLIGMMLLLLGPTKAGILRIYLMYLLEAAC